MTREYLIYRLMIEAKKERYILTKEDRKYPLDDLTKKRQDIDNYGLIAMRENEKVREFLEAYEDPFVDLFIIEQIAVNKDDNIVE